MNEWKTVADLKRLYIKAHPQRDSKTREEDLLKNFLDGLADRDDQYFMWNISRIHQIFMKQFD